jgi:hypothetical protein
LRSGIDGLVSVPASAAGSSLQMSDGRRRGADLMMIATPAGHFGTSLGAEHIGV